MQFAYLEVCCSKFKLPSSSDMPENTASLASTRANLGPFAKMMLESTDIAFRCKFCVMEGIPRVCS